MSYVFDKYNYGLGKLRMKTGWPGHEELKMIQVYDNQHFDIVAFSLIISI